MKKRILSGLLCLLMIIGTVMTPTLAEGVVSLTITLPEGADNTLLVGETLSLTVEVSPAEESILPLIWASDNPACAAVDENGDVTAVAAGEAHITVATADNTCVSDAFTVNVTAPVIAPAPPVLVQEITVTAPEGVSSMQAGDTMQLSAVVAPDNADDPSVTWSVTDGTGHGVIDPHGVLSGESAGTITVTATAKDGSGIAGSLQINILDPVTPEPASVPSQTQVTPVASIAVTDVSGNADSVGVQIGGTVQLLAAVSPDDATDKSVLWSIVAPDSADPDAGAAEIDAQGLLRGLTPGSVTVKATSQSDSAISGTLVVNIIDPLYGAGATVTGVTVTAADDVTAVATEHTLQLTATVAPAEAAQTVTWSVTSGTAATIDETTGLLTAGAAEGTVTIRATSTADTNAYGELLLNVVTAYSYVLVLNANPDPTVMHDTGVLHFAGTGASSQLSRTSQTYYPTSDPQLSATVAGYTVDQVKKIGYTDYVCIGVGEHCYVWMEKTLADAYSAAGVRDTVAAEMISVYEGRPYQALSTLATGAQGGTLPTMDHTGKLSILMEQLTTSTGYFAGEDGITAIHIKAKAAADYTYGDLDAYAGLLAHEGQHALFQHYVCENDAGAEMPLRWLNEGLSVAAMDWVWGGDGNGDTGWLSTIGGNDRICGGESLAYANYRENSGLDYGLPYLFVRYLTDQAAGKYDPLPHLAKFYQTRLGSDAPETYLNSVIGSLGLSGNTTFAEALENFYIAAVVQAGSGVNGFCGDPVVSKRVTYPIFDGASGISYELPGTGALVLRTSNGVFVPPLNAGGDIRFVPFNEDASASTWGGGGDGTPDSPYEVDANSILGAIALNPSGYYKLTTDVNLTDSAVFTIDSFTGTLNGNGKTIRGVSAPLIYENSGTVCNLNVELAMNGQYSGYTGGVVCHNTGIIRDVNVSGTFSGRLTGTNPYGYPVVGALVGKNAGSGEIYKCKSDVVMTPGLPANHAYIGQIAGCNAARIYDCIAAGSIDVTQSAAGSYDLFVGGLTGWLYSEFFTASLKTSYSITSLHMQANGAGNNGKLGRLVGCESTRSNPTYAKDCYGLNADSIPAAGSTQTVSPDMVLGAACLKTETELQTPSTFSGWDTGVWNLTDGSYPTFGTTSDPTSLTVTDAKSNYYIGETLDLTGAYITLPNGVDTVSVKPEMLYLVPSLDTPGNYTVRGVYDAIPFSFPITVEEPLPEQITALAVTNPARSEYNAGSVFEPGGVVLTATIDGNSVTIVSNFTVDKTAPLAVTDTLVTYTYFGKTATQPITVRARAIQSVVRTAPATRTSFYDGEQLSLSGLTLRLTYSDGAVVNGVTADHFGQYGLKLLRSKGGVLSEIPYTKMLTASEDNGASLYLYLGSTVPATLSGVYCAAMTLDVGNRAHLDDQTIVMHYGFPNNSAYDEYLYTDPIEGGSYNYTTRLINGTVPSGITVETPGMMVRENFSFSGRAASAFDVTLVYEITDNEQDNTFYVRIHLIAEPLSDACDILTATLGGYPCVVGEDTLTVVLPQNTSLRLTSLAINAEWSPGATQADGSINGNTFDCSSGKTPKVTGYPQSNYTKNPDGPKKEYTLHASVATGGPLAEPTNLDRSIAVVTWDEVDGADIYLVTLMRCVGDSDYEVSDMVASCTVTEPRFDMWPSISESGKSGRYYVTVRALDNTGARSTSAEVSTVDNLYYSNLTPVTKITISGPDSVIVNQTAAYAASVAPYNAGNAGVTWDVESGTGEATITSAGVLTGVAPGTVTVKALAQDGSGVSAEYTVTVLDSSASRTVTVNVSGIDMAERALWIDGVCYNEANGLTINGSVYTVELTTMSATNAIVYSFNSLAETDMHKVYPTGMTVWMLAYANDAYTVTRAEDLDNLLVYSGSSIRITGKQGIRMITSIDTNTKKTLIGSGINGYTLLEYGTVVAWTSELGANSLTLHSSCAKPAYAYKKNVADPVFNVADNLTQYTNVLVGFDIEKCRPDLTMRPYIVLLDANGKSVTLYGGAIQRSIGYIAYQNRSAFTPKTASYRYIWNIIHGVYGNAYDGEYRG